MRRMWALITAMLLVFSGCGETSKGINEPYPRNPLAAEGAWDCWEGEELELQRRLVRWYGINLESRCPEQGFRESYDSILAGPGGMMGAIRFPDTGITVPVFHQGWAGAGFIHDGDTPFPAGEGGTPVLTLAGDRQLLLAVYQSIKQDGVFQILILDGILTYRFTEEAPEEVGCVLVIPREGGELRLTGVLLPESRG